MQMFLRMEQQAVEPDAALCANALEALESKPAALWAVALPQRTLCSTWAQLQRVRGTLRSSRDSQQVALKKDGTCLASAHWQPHSNKRPPPMREMCIVFISVLLFVSSNTGRYGRPGIATLETRSLILLLPKIGSYCLFLSRGILQDLAMAAVAMDTLECLDACQGEARPKTEVQLLGH